MAMDIGNRGGVFLTRFLEGSDDLQWSRWYVTDPNAPAYPTWHAFGLPVWEGDFRDEFDGAGVQFTGRQRRSDNLDVPKTFRPVGKSEWYADGIPSYGPTFTTACGVPLIAPAGGGVAGGTGFPDYRTIISLFCVCATPPALEERDYHLIATACGCGSPSGPRYPRYHLIATACGCGYPSLATIRSRLLVASACGCGSPATGLLPDYDLVASACGCGSPSSTITTGPTVLLFDTFTGAGTTLLSAHTPDVGGPWVIQIGRLVAAGGVCYHDTTSSDTHTATCNVGFADVTITGTVSVHNQNYASGFVGRWSNLNNYWLCVINRQFNLPTQLLLAEWVGGNFFIRASAPITLTLGAPYTLVWKMAGFSHHVSWSGGTEVLTFSSSNGSANTRHGPRVETFITIETDTYVDDIQITTP